VGVIVEAAAAGRVKFVGGFFFRGGGESSQFWGSVSEIDLFWVSVSTFHQYFEIS